MALRRRGASQDGHSFRLSIGWTLSGFSVLLLSSRLRMAGSVCIAPLLLVFVPVVLVLPVARPYEEDDLLNLRSFAPSLFFLTALSSYTVHSLECRTHSRTNSDRRRCSRERASPQLSTATEIASKGEGLGVRNYIKPFSRGCVARSLPLSSCSPSHHSHSHSHSQTSTSQKPCVRTRSPSPSLLPLPLSPFPTSPPSCVSIRPRRPPSLLLLLPAREALLTPSWTHTVDFLSVPPSSLSLPPSGLTRVRRGCV